MNKVKIGDFIKLTGSTIKTVKYYHKIGLLPESERSDGGYRLYGPAELNRMRLIKHLKSLGLNLQNIKEIMGDGESPRSSREVLQSLRSDVLNEKQIPEERLTRIDTLLRTDAPLLDENCFDSSSFQMITGILGPDQMEGYSVACPDIYDQHRRLSGILDDFKWGDDFEGSLRALAEYFQTHPEKYQLALESGKCWAEIAQLNEDDPRIESFARESAVLVNSMPPVKELYCAHPGIERPLESLYQEMVAGVLTPAQVKYQELFRKFLVSRGEEE